MIGRALVALAVMGILVLFGLAQVDEGSVLWLETSRRTEARAKEWTYNAEVKHRLGESIPVRLVVLEIEVEYGTANVSIVRTPWQTNVELLTFIPIPKELKELVGEPSLRFGDDLGCLAYCCWPSVMFWLLPILDDPFPRFSDLVRFLRQLPIIALTETAKSLEASFYVTVNLGAAYPVMVGIEFKTGEADIVDTPAGRLELRPVQFKVTTVDGFTYIFTTLCTTSGLLYPAGMPIKGEGVVQEIGITDTEFKWELVGVGEVCSEAVLAKLAEALAEMARAAPRNAEEVKKKLKDIGIELPQK